MYPIPTSDHNEELAGDTLTSVSFNYQWRKLIADAIDLHLQKVAATISDESDRQEFEQRCGNLLIDFYNEDIVDNTPVGLIMAYPSLTPPTKWVLCNGQALSKVDYAALFTLIGTKYGSTSTTFNVPNLSDRFIYGQRIVGGSPTIDNTGGATRVTLDVSEMPAHSHVQRGRNSPAGAVFQSTITTNTTNTTPVDTTTTTGNTGGGSSHENMPPYHSLAWMIKALP